METTNNNPEKNPKKNWNQTKTNNPEKKEVPAEKVQEKINVASDEKEEETRKIFNLSETPLTDSKNNAPNKKVERNPVKAWGQK